MSLGTAADPASLYDMAGLYDAVVRRGPCEAFYAEEARRAGGPVLELACGTGRLAIPLAEAGHEVVGLDLSRGMLARAARKAAARRVRVAWLLGDMRGFELSRRFGLIVLSCNSLAHLATAEEIRACLGAVRRHLAPGGRFAFDVVLPDPQALAVEGPPRRLDLGPNPPSAVEAEEAARYDPVTQLRHAEWRLRPRGVAAPIVTRFALRQFFPAELPLHLALAGLELEARFGDFARNSLGPASLNQVCLAREAG